MFKTLLLLFFTTLSLAQSQVITGVVAEENRKPLESANIIAKPLQEKASLKFAIADNKGRYRLELDKGVKYEITVSYIGYVEQVWITTTNDTEKTHDFILQPTGEQLKEIVIKHVFKPIVIKKDTITYDVKSFANGNERKMKEILEKLPGVEVDKKGNVTVQGKKVTKMLVEGKSFFGGGSKLAVENIPADALDKIEVIDHFNEVGFMKQVSDSDDLAMNVKLKADKKKFVFGDVEAGAEVGNVNNGFYLAHAALFYYSPKTNLSFIGDANNIGKRTFTFDDLLRFGGGMSSFLSGRKSFTNLYSFATDNNEVVQNKSQFAALNFSHDFSNKLEISGFSILSKVLTASQIESKNEYLQNSAIAFENKLQKGDNRSLLGISNIKLNYSPNAKEKWYYNGQYQSSTNDLNNTINSITNLRSSVFQTLNQADNTAIKQYLEWHKSYNDAHTTTFVVNHAYDTNTPQTRWFTDQPFLTGIIPIQSDNTYTIDQIKRVQNHSVDALFKHYWVINNDNHLYTIFGNNNGRSQLFTSEKQLLNTNGSNSFSTGGFGNDINYQLNDAYIGLEYKFRIGIWTNKPALYSHWYAMQTEQASGRRVLEKQVWLPQWTSEFEFNKSETLNFSYKLEVGFPEVSQLADQFTLQNYNLVFKGNALLENEQFHSANLRYSKMNMYRGITWNAMASFVKKENNIRNEVILQGINQVNTPFLRDNPETNYNVNGSFTKKIYRFNLRFSSSLSWFNYLQNLNGVTTSNDRNNQKVGVLIKTAYKKWPTVSVGYTKGFSQFKGITQSQFQFDTYNADAEFSFFKHWTYKLEYENTSNTNANQQRNFYDLANTSLRYQKKNSPFGFELSMNNVLNTSVKNDFSFSDYLISERTTFVLPRVVLFSISYKL
ncbi:carboxypeptidase-like regulatory domain-containing protein [Flavobacterium ammonificans]|uniref:carboxypeptidase-like regulatory domain-containing protein n=1 Tax=Flavobacterium ammonificans TaxID=1751056 RepID=UPI001E575A6B|nr:carboxypeptidase-like regulatory domain-containing protein [Flavobacterium ammonificans]